LVPEAKCVTIGIGTDRPGLDRYLSPTPWSPAWVSVSVWGLFLGKVIITTQSLDLSIIIVNWNVRALLRRCLSSILAPASPDPDVPYTWLLRSAQAQVYRFEVLVVDSASSDGSVEMVRAEFPALRLYASQENLGYAGGNNWGMRNSHGRYALLLNPDTRVLGDALSEMVAYLDRHPAVGVLGPQLLYPDGGVQSSRRRFPTLRTALIESTFLQKWFPAHPVLRRYYVQDCPDDAISDVDWVTGACMLIRREAMEQVGLIDEAFFMYSEELDWQRRIRAAGWKVTYLPTAQIVHDEGKSSEQVIVFRHIQFQKSKIRYFKKHYGKKAGVMVRCWLLLNYAYEWGIEAPKWLLGYKRDLRRERMRAYGQVLRSRLSE
jgi:N-acetylglucosaminyl-diphospho-decaprenol L-rhamnosyltransferase